MAESRQAKSVSSMFLSRRLLRLFVALLLLNALGLGPKTLAASELDDFGSKVKKKKDQSRKSNSAEGSSKKGGGSSPNGDSDDGCMGALAGIFFTIWWDVNSRVRYDDYPYAHEDRSWILYPDKLFASSEKKSDTSSGAKGQDISPKQRRYKEASSFFINTAVGGSYIDVESRAFWLELRSRGGGIFGLRADWRRYYDSDSYMDHASLGGEVPLLQYGNVALNFFVQWGSFRGDLYMDGTIVGGSLQLFPGRLVTMEFATSQQYYDGVTFTHLRGLLGFMMGRGELFLGYDYLTSGSAVLDGWDLGLRFWW